MLNASGISAPNQLTYGSVSSRAGQSIQPQTPCLLQQADEIIKFVSELEHNVGRIDGNLYGERPENNAAPKPGLADSVEAKLSDACTRIASLCGYTATILGKITGQ
jgi:hypothetical protein